MLQQLRSLGLNRNKLKMLPEELKYCTTLQILGLEGNCLTKLPEAIGNHFLATN